jgi:hypothetical protein
MLKRAIERLGTQIVPICIGALIFMLLPNLAHAAGGNLSCNGSGGVAGGSLFNTTSSGLCQNSGQFIQHLFSNIICMYTIIIDGVLNTLYCGIQYAIKDTLAIVIILYIAIFGVQILTGQTQLAAGEIIMRLLKICFVWYFATQSAYGIGIAFNFFLAIMNDGVMWVVSAVTNNAANSPMGAYQYIDYLVYRAIIGPFSEANSKVVGFFLVMSISFFPIFLMGISFLWETAMLLISCIFTFLLSMSAIAFLISMSPIFMSFMLFQSTFYLFENWLRYMISYCMQIIVVFGIVTMWVQVVLIFIGFFNDLSNVIYPYCINERTGPVVDPTDTWGICKLSYGNNALGPTVQCDGGPAPDAKCGTVSQLVPPSGIMEIKGFLYYVIFHMTSLILLAYAFRILLRNASQIARDLVGPAYVPMLGKGFGMEALGTPTGYPRRMHMRSMGGSDAKT